MMKKRKQKWAQIDGAMEGDNLKKAMERRKKALDRHDKKNATRDSETTRSFTQRNLCRRSFSFSKRKHCHPYGPRFI